MTTNIVSQGVLGTGSDTGGRLWSDLLGYARISTLEALARITGGEPPPMPYDQDDHTGDFWPRTDDPAWSSAARRLGASCARG